MRNLRSSAVNIEMIVSPASVHVRAAGCSQLWWFMKHKFSGQGNGVIQWMISI